MMTMSFKDKELFVLAHLEAMASKNPEGYLATLSPKERAAWAKGLTRKRITDVRDIELEVSYGQRTRCSDVSDLSAFKTEKVFEFILGHLEKLAEQNPDGFVASVAPNTRIGWATSMAQYGIADVRGIEIELGHKQAKKLARGQRSDDE